MRQLAIAGSILLVCLLGLASSASARNRYTAAIAVTPTEQQSQTNGWDDRPVEQDHAQRRLRCFERELGLGQCHA